MSYISKIREKIGHELLIYLGAGVIVYSDEKFSYKNVKITELGLYMRVA
ncbi:hypothetical protein [Lactococcus lactis]